MDVASLLKKLSKQQHITSNRKKKASKRYCDICKIKVKKRCKYLIHLTHVHKVDVTSLLTPKWKMPLNPNNPNNYCEFCEGGYKVKYWYFLHLKVVHRMDVSFLLLNKPPKPIHHQNLFQFQSHPATTQRITISVAVTFSHVQVIFMLISERFIMYQ